MDTHLGIEQTLRYAEGLRDLYAAERAQRRRAEDARDRLEGSYRMTVRALASALELRDDATGGHTVRVAELALGLARVVAPDLATDPQLEYGFVLHDIGKIGVPDAVLLKKGPLDADEQRQMRTHTVLGERLIAGIPYLSDTVRAVVASHHERWDGSGYPEGLHGDEIPLAARIFSLADAFDAMTNDRPYRAALPVDNALAEIRAASGSQFEPELAEAFIEVLEARRAA